MNGDFSKDDFALQVSDPGFDVLVPLLAGVAVSAAASILMDLDTATVWRWAAFFFFVASASYLVAGQTGVFKARALAMQGTRTLSNFREKLDVKLRRPMRNIWWGEATLVLAGASLVLDYLAG